MAVDYVERHFDYVYLTPSLTANQIVVGQQQKINADAPFLLRSFNAFKFPNTGNPNELSVRYADSNGRFRSNALVNLAGLLNVSSVTLPQIGNQFNTPVHPQIVYPPNSNIEIDLRNDGANTITFALLFRGITLHPRGSVLAPQFPSKFALIPFVYTVPFQIVRGAAPVVLADQILQVKSDADFLFTHGQVVPDFSQGIGTFYDFRMRLKDAWGKFYSNDYVPIACLLGKERSAGVVGTERPGMIYPGIYLKANSFLWFDLQLNDTGGAATLFGQIAFNGFKVFPK